MQEHGPSFQLVDLSPEDTSRFESIVVNDDQVPFVSSAKEVLDQWIDAGGPQKFKAFGMLAQGDHPVGIFTIHPTNNGIGYDLDNPRACWLKAFMVSRDEQGKGYGKSAIQALKKQLKPEFDFVHLTVNCKNPVAKSVYEKSGFKDTEQLYHGGAAGPQHILTLSLI